MSFFFCLPVSMYVRALIEQWSVISLSVVDTSIIWLVGGLEVLRCPTKMPVLLQTKQYRSVSADQTREKEIEIESNIDAYCICWRHMST